MENKPTEILGQMTEAVENLHKKSTSATIELGKMRQVLPEAKSLWEKIEKTQGQDSLKMIGTAVLASQLGVLKGLENNMGDIYTSLKGIAPSGIVGMTMTTASFSAVEYEPSKAFIQITKESNVDDYSENLNRISPALGDTYRSAAEALFGLGADSERTALLKFRQTFDHLFDALAPDEQVRRSPFFTDKEGDKKDQVLRRERISYALDQHVRSNNDLLKNSTDHMIEVYNELNSAHKRGEIDQRRARAVCFEMKSMIEQWVDSVIDQAVDFGR